MLGAVGQDNHFEAGTPRRRALGVDDCADGELTALLFELRNILIDGIHQTSLVDVPADLRHSRTRSYSSGVSTSSSMPRSSTGTSFVVDAWSVINCRNVECSDMASSSGTHHVLIATG